MTTVYQQCPFCERVFEIRSTDYQPMKRHIRIAHANEQGKGKRERSDNKPRQRRFER